VNIHVDPNKRKSLDKAAFSSADMQQLRDTVLSLVALLVQNLIDMLTEGLVLSTTMDSWQSWDAERLLRSLRRLYPAEAGNRFQPSNESCTEVANCVNSIEVMRTTDPQGPTNNARTKFLIAWVQAHVDIGEPRADQIDTLIRDMI